MKAESEMQETSKWNAYGRNQKAKKYKNKKEKKTKKNKTIINPSNSISQKTKETWVHYCLLNKQTPETGIQQRKTSPTLDAWDLMKDESTES